MFEETSPKLSLSVRLASCLSSLSTLSSSGVEALHVVPVAHRIDVRRDGVGESGALLLQGRHGVGRQAERLNLRQQRGHETTLVVSAATARGGGRRRGGSGRR